VRQAENSGNWVAQSRSRLALRRAEKPATKAGQIRALWPEIEAALHGGQSMKSIRKWLEEDAGITLSFASLTSYISRIRRREDVQSRPPVLAAPVVPAQSTSSGSATDSFLEGRSKPLDDPLASAMRALSKPRLDIRDLHGDGDPEFKNLI
jgi:hypothetical protein